MDRAPPPPPPPPPPAPPRPPPRLRPAPALRAAGADRAGLHLRERTLVLTDVVTDPTLPRTNTVECPKCNHGEAVFFQSTSRNDAEAMTLFFVCSSCGERWRD